MSSVENITQPSKKAKISATSVAAASADVICLKEGQGEKSPNFHSDKDELLAMAWVSASDNSIVGTGQKAKVFWADVHSRYCALQERSLSSEVGYPRSWNQLKGR
jgi:hypothetical protein